MRRLLGVLLACAVLPFAAGCGDAGDSVKSAVDPVAQAATNTANAGTVQLSMTGSVSASGIEIPLRSTGAFDLKNKRGHMEVTTSVPGKGDIKIEELLDGLVVYMRSDALTSNLPDGKHWIKLDLQKLGKSEGLDMNSAMSTGGSDPTQMLSYLNAASDSIDRIGTQVVRGTQTTHYHVVVDLLKIASTVPAAKQAAVRRTFRHEVELVGTHTIPIDVWIDSQGLVRREHFDISMHPATVTVPVEMEMTIDFFDFGAPVHVVPPPARMVADLADLVPPGPSA
jgi:hypothetical protein